VGNDFTAAGWLHIKGIMTLVPAIITRTTHSEALIVLGTGYDTDGWLHLRGVGELGPPDALPVDHLHRQRVGAQDLDL
jgi:hypothetical protein